MQIHPHTWPRPKATSRSKWKAIEEAVHILSRKFQGTKKHEGCFLPGGVFNPCSTEAANRCSPGVHPPHRVCPGYPINAHAVWKPVPRGKMGDGEIGKRVKHVLRGLPSRGVSHARSYPSCKGKKDKPVPVLECTWFTKKEMLDLQRSSITSRSAADLALRSRNP